MSRTVQRKKTLFNLNKSYGDTRRAPTVSVLSILHVRINKSSVDTHLNARLSTTTLEATQNNSKLNLTLRTSLAKIRDQRGKTTIAVLHQTVPLAIPHYPIVPSQLLTAPSPQHAMISQRDQSHESMKESLPRTTWNGKLVPTGLLI